MSEQIRPWPKVGPAKRWGPVALVLVVCVGVGIVATTRNPTGQTASGSSTPESVASASAIPIQYAAAKAKGTAGNFTWSNCDKTTGRITFPTVYAPGCVPEPKGSNGGATYPGVTADTIKVVYYFPPPGDITASVSGLLDTNAKVTDTVRAYTKMFESRFQTYGRKVQVVPIVGSGISTDETAARADAVKVATQIKAFASIGGPAQTSVYQDELAARHVLCLGCGLSVPDATFQKDKPFMWGQLPTPEQYLENIGVFVTQQLNNKPAQWAGDPKMRTEKRVFGTVHYDQDPPVFNGVTDVVNAQGAKLGWKPKVNESYLLDLAKLPQTAAGLVAKLKQAGVTTVMFLGDPIMPIYLTKAATAQNYFPEWIVTGTVLTDTTAIARLYDQKQWAHAFGVSTLPVRTAQSESDAYRTYRWYYGQMPAAFKTASTFYPNLLQLYTGIQLAGANLTPQTFAAGLFSYPPTGGQPGAPHSSYGNHNLFKYTKGPDFTSVDDSTLIWWDAKATGKDEQGKDGVGMYRYVANGKRYLPGKLPTALQPFFDPADTATVYATVPPELTTPNYPSPAGSPAARKGN